MKHMPGERWAHGIFYDLHHRTKTSNVEVMTDVQAPLNAYAQEETHCELDSFQNFKKTFVSVLAHLGDTRMWHSSALRALFFPGVVIECCLYIKSYFLLSIKMQPALGSSEDLDRGLVPINIII